MGITRAAAASATRFLGGDRGADAACGGPDEE